MAYLITIYIVFVAYSWYSKYKENESKEEVLVLVKRDVKVLFMVVIVLGVFKFVQWQDTGSMNLMSFDSNSLYMSIKPYLIWILLPLVFILIVVNNKIKK